MRRILFSFALLSSAFAQRPFVPTTTVAAETGNNSSASNSVAAYTSSHAASGNVSKEPIRKLLYPGATTKVYAALMGWFGKSGHISVGYNSQSATQVKKQVEDMMSRGIDGAIIAWYGKNSYENKTTLELMRQAEAHPGFSFAIMIDHGTIQWDSLGLAPTDALIAQMNYIADTYYASPAYAKVGGRPVILEFALESYNIDWVRVRSSVRGNPVVIFRNPNGWTKTLSDGAYSWEPEKTEMSYLDYFYTQAAKYPYQQTMGSFSPSFDDSLATWSANRYADGQCGQLWLKKAAEANKYWSATKQLPFVQIATWNDYEEGSTIENGIDNCVSVSAESSGSVISWTLDGIGSENTIDHYTVFASQDGVSLMPVANLPVGSRSYDLAESGLVSGDYVAYVKAVGKPSLLNHLSGGVNVAFGTTATPGTSNPDYALQIPFSNVTFSRTQPATISLNAVTSSGFNGTVGFSCAGLPTWAQCSFAPQSVQVSSGGAATTLTIRAVQSASFASSTLLMLLSISVFIGLGRGFGKTKQVGVVAGVCMMAFTLAACGGGAQQSSSTPQSQTVETSSQSSAITVVATPSDATQPTRTVTLKLTMTN